MNKQEAIKLVKNTSYNVPINDSVKYLREETVIKIIDELDEQEKPVVPQYVADMIVKRKEQGCSLVTTLVTLGAFEDAQKWIRSGDNGDTFAKAWLYGYEIAEEKRYTAKLKLTDEYLGYESRFEDLLHYKVPDNSAKKEKTYHFTKDDLVKYHIWGNDNYEVKEVEE